MTESRKVLAKNVALVNAILMTHSRTPLRAGELARAAGLPRQIVAAALETLEKRGLAIRRRVGDYDVFAPDLESLYYPAAYLTALVDLPFAEALAPFRPIAAYVYGSMATPGGARPTSDLDLLVVGDFRNASSVREAAELVGERLGRRVDTFLLTPESMEAGVRQGDAHIRAATSGVRIFGKA